jgi:hypothetical protein
LKNTHFFKDFCSIKKYKHKNNKLLFIIIVVVIITSNSHSLISFERRAINSQVDLASLKGDTTAGQRVHRKATTTTVINLSNKNVYNI